MCGRQNVWTLKTLKDRCEEDGQCWIWQQATSSNGHPQASIGGKGGLSVRGYVYTQLMGKKLPKGYVVSSRCRNRLCVSPECLVQRTRSQILVDQYAHGIRNPEREHAKRMRSIIMGRPGHVKLSMDKARDVRRRLAAGESIVAIAAAHGVNEKTIWKIKHNRAWLEQSVNASVFTWSGTLKEAA